MSFERTAQMIGDDALIKLSKSNIILFGVGGVGGYVAEMLARTNIGRITLVDFDKVDKTNLNRQIIALNSTIGKYKVDVMKERIFDINPACKVTAIAERVSADNVSKLLEGKYDYIIDAIDSVPDKLALIKHAKQNNMQIISALGAGNRYKQVPSFEVCDVYKTKNDGLAKKMRKLLRDEGIENLQVVYTSDEPESQMGGKVGSISYFPAVCGCIISSVVINCLIKGDNL